MTRFALATSVIGQGGSYHSEFLLGEGFDVHGTKCHTSLFNTDRIDSLYQPPHQTGRHFSPHHGDLTDISSLVRIIQQVPSYEVQDLSA